MRWSYILPGHRKLGNPQERESLADVELPQRDRVCAEHGPDGHGEVDQGQDEPLVDLEVTGHDGDEDEQAEHAGQPEEDGE